MNRETNPNERPEKMGFETPYSIYTHCRVCGARMFLGVGDLGKVCPDCDPDQWGQRQEE
jgi:hypothetical protein